jgi:integrase
MATVNHKRNSDGSRSYTAQVRVRGFRPLSKTFHERDHGGRKQAQAAATAWGEREEQTLREQRTRGAVRADLGTLKLAQLIAEYLADPEVQQLRTHSGLAMQLAWWCEQHGEVRALEFCNPILLRAARERLLAFCTPSTCNRYLAVARAAVNWARAAGLLPADKCVWPPRLMLKEPRGRERFLSADELKRALDAARADTLIGGELMRAAVQFAVGTGIRQAEQLRVRWQDLDERTSTVAVHVTKTSTSRRVHVPANVLETLRQLRTTGKVRPLPSAYVFADSDGKPIPTHRLVDAWERTRARAGLPGVRWHDLRHTCASVLAQAGSSLLEISRQLGHLSAQTSARYSHLVAGTAPTGAGELNKLLKG